MRFLMALALTFVLLTLPTTGRDTVLWSLANGLGFVACLGLVVVSAFGVRAPPRGAGYRFHLHLGWWLLAAVGAHVGLLLLDPTMVEYLLPGAPAYIWAGWAAALPLALLCLLGTRQRRRSQFASAREFRTSHLAWTWVVLACTAWHVVGSGYYIANPLLQSLFVAVLVGGPLWVVTVRSDGHFFTGRAPSLGAFLLISLATLSAFVGTRMLAAA